MLGADDEVLLAAAVRAQQALPAFSLRPEAFVPYLRERLPAGRPREAALAALHVEDLLLSWACVAGDPQALALFDTRHLAPAAAALRRIDPSPDFAAEVLQRVRDKVLLADPARGLPARLTGYSGRGTLSSWLRAAVLRTGLNLRRDQRYAAGAGAPDSDVRALGADPELVHIKAQHRQLLKDSLAAALRGLSVRERTLLRMHLVEGVSIDKLAPIYGVHRATAARWVGQAREALLTATRQLVAQHAGLGRDELTSFFAVLESGLSLSLSRLLAPEGAGGSD